MVDMLFADFAGDESVGACLDGVLQQPATGAGAPGDGTDQSIGIRKQGDAATVVASTVGGEHGAAQRHAHAKLAQHDEPRLADGSPRGQPQTAPHARVVANFGMHIERQVIGVEIDVCGQKRCEALAVIADNSRIITFPEKPVVNDDGVGFGGYCGVDQGLIGRDADHNVRYRGAARYLQAVNGNVLETANFEELIEVTRQLVTRDRACRLSVQSLILEVLNKIVKINGTHATFPGLFLFLR